MSRLALLVACALLAGCGKPVAPAPEATTAATSAGATHTQGAVDPEFASAAKKLLDDAEILATLSKVDRSDDAKFKERQDAVAEDLIRLPQNDNEPMKSLRRSCEAVAKSCASFGDTRGLAQFSSDNQKLYDGDVAKITSSVNRLREAIRNNEAFVFPFLEN